MRKKMLSLAGVLVGTLVCASTVHAAICSIVRVKPDGTRIEMTVEGDTCTVDYNTSTCSCT